MRYCVLYPKAENVHLIKDVGMIAYKLNKLYGYDSFLASYKNGEYDYLNNAVKGLKQEFIKKDYSNLKNIYLYLKENSSKIDVLQIFHVTFNSVFYAALYKFFNKGGTIFLKLDCTSVLLDKIKNMSFMRRLFFNFYLKRVDIIAVEQKKLYDPLKKLLKNNGEKLVHIPNGIDFDMDCFKSEVNFSDKENIILSVGRIGSTEKSHDLLMNGFKNINKNLRDQWKLVFVGPIEEDFKKTIDEFYRENEELKDRVIFKGAVYDREELYSEYRKAKIFCLTSNFESVGIALIEAVALGDAIVSTKVGIASEIEAYGGAVTVPVGDEKGITKALNKLMLSDNLEEISKNAEKMCREEYNWNTIARKLNSKINEVRGNI